MDKSKKQELKSAYKERKVTGGVYCIECSGNGRRWILSTVDMEGARNRFDFAIQIKSCPDPQTRREWTEYGTDSFSFTVLEELDKEETQTSEQFAADVKALYEMYISE